MRTTPTGKSFGRYVRLLRRARGLTHEELAERCGLSPDTIRRLEHGSFSPSLDTLIKLVRGLDLQLSTLFIGYELNELDSQRELFDLLGRQDPRVRRIGTEVLRCLIAQLDAMAKARDGAGDSDGDGEK
jgi:transcriptional regulator with XRE-family HTH domain